MRRIQLTSFGNRDQQLPRELGVVGDLAEGELAAAAMARSSGPQFLIDVETCDIGWGSLYWGSERVTQRETEEGSDETIDVLHPYQNCLVNKRP